MTSNPEIERNPGTLYSFKLEFYKKQFHGQSATNPIGSDWFDFNDKEEFLNKLWNFVKNHVQREVCITFKEDGTAVASFVEKLFPDQDDMEKYVVVQLPWNRTTYRLLQLTTKQFQSWKGKQINSFIYIYGSDIKQKSDFLLVQNQLLDTIPRDRAGAANNQIKNQVADELMQRHGDAFEASRAGWLCWATYILAQPAEQREQLMDGDPPENYEHLIHPIPPPAGVTLQAHRRGLSMARTVNDGFARDIEEINEVYQTCVRQIQHLGNLIKNLQTRVSCQRNFISSAENSIDPEETPFSHQCASNVTEQVDIDHI